jgi:hypothetical protein
MKVLFLDKLVRISKGSLNTQAVPWAVKNRGRIQAYPGWFKTGKIDPFKPFLGQMLESGCVFRAVGIVKQDYPARRERLAGNLGAPYRSLPSI